MNKCNIACRLCIKGLVGRIANKNVMHSIDNFKIDSTFLYEYANHQIHIQYNVILQTGQHKICILFKISAAFLLSHCCLSICFCLYPLSIGECVFLAG